MTFRTKLDIFLWKSNDPCIQHVERAEEEIRIQQQTKHLKIGLIFLNQSENLNLALYNPNGDNLLMINIQQWKEQPHLL